MDCDTTKEATLSGNGQTYYQSIPWQTVAVHGLLEKLTPYVCMYCVYVGVCSVMGPPQSNTAPTDIFICISLYTNKTAICSAVYCTNDTVPSVGHGSLTVVVA